MFYQTFRQYIQKIAPIGIGFGVVSILMRLIGLNIFLPLEVFLKYGIVNVTGYSLIYIIALALAGLLGKRIRREMPNGCTISDYLQYKLNPAGYWLMMAILVVTSMESMVMLGMAADLLFDVFSWQVQYDVLVFFMFCSLFAGLGGIVLIHRLALVQIIFVYAAVILIPLYFFVLQGVPDVYAGMRLYHPYMLVTNHYEGLLFIGAAIFIVLGQSLIDLALWQRFYLITEKKVFPAFLLSGIILAAFPVSFSGLFMIALYSGGYYNVSSLLLDVVGQLDNPFLLLLFIACFFCAISAAYGAGLHALIGLLVSAIDQFMDQGMNDKQKLRTGYFLAIVLSVITFAFTMVNQQTFWGAFTFFGIIYVAAIAPLLVIVVSEGKVADFIPACALAGLAAGYSCQSVLGNLQAIFVSLLVSLGLVILYKLATTLRKWHS